MQTLTQTKYLSTSEVSVYLGVCEATIRGLTKRKEDPLPCLKYGRHLWKFPFDEVEQWAKREAGVGMA
ncbi:MAG: helix-turn-helix domain-containing protein [Spirochaetes bacterium]|nr:helix-turn-helix domain-containing protein [Spirochaetota bacterium]